LPTFIAIILATSAIYLVIIPAFEKSFVDGKKEMIRQLTKATLGIVEFYQREEVKGRLTKEDAQERALAVIQYLRYGEEGRDYFWINDTTPRLVMHPYSEELVGADLSTFVDASGKMIFQEIKKKVEQDGSGFIDYSWNKKYSKEVIAPKLSYVQLFKPWEWVIGTGVFLDDVAIKTEEISKRLSQMGLAAIGLLSLILLYVGRQSYLFEKQRNDVQQELAKSKAKYKRLVEMATEPILMMYEGRSIYSNRPFQSLTGLSPLEIERADLTKIFSSITESEDLQFVEDGKIISGQFDAGLYTANGELTKVALAISKMDLDGREAVVIQIKDDSSVRQIEQKLDESREKYNQLTSRLDIAVFRAEANSDLRLIEMNQAFRNLLGVDETEKDVGLKELLKRNNLSLNLYEEVLDNTYLKNKILPLRRGDTTINLSISLALTKNVQGELGYCDGIIEDVSDVVQKEKDREQLIVELQTSLLFLNQPVRDVQGEFVICEESLAVHEAAKLMRENNSSSLLVKNEDGDIVGIATDLALKERVVADRMEYDVPVAKIMSSPLIYIDENALIFEAVMLMEEKRVKHLVVKNEQGETTNVLSNENLLNVHRYSSTYLVDEIAQAETIEEISKAHERLPRIIKSLVDSGAHARNITRITSRVSETVLNKLLDFAILEMGEPPARFAFLTLGSEGREEQTLATDQDNALIFENVDEEKKEEVGKYFLELSEKVCTWLDQVGYNFCKGEVMAMNPKWCQPITVWKNYFSRWITKAKPQDLLEVSIFFDFRCMYGEESLVAELREHIFRRVADKDVFYYQLAQNALLFKLPVDFFGNISVESGGDHPNTFNIKYVIALIVGYARLYAINFALEETNTLQRLDRLKSRSFIGRELHEDITEAYNYLMQIRFTHQVNMLNKGQEPDNHIYLDELNYMEKSALKKIFSQVGSLQKKLHAIGRMEVFF
jgi:signal-transduction protein with cAMP-binding, CBS, and nucleotidyltransferase domain/PAS domain-containing protein